MTGGSGAVGVITAGLAAVTIVLCLVVADVARVVVLRSQLATAADAAALAAAPVTFSAFGGSGDPVEAAAEIAAANGGVLLDCRCGLDRTWQPRTVLVEVGGTARLPLLGDRRLHVRAAAEFRPVALAEP